MIIIKSIKEIQEHISQLKEEGKKIGFIPTMGALHQGHLSLIRASTKACDITISSIFVNPTQFNDKDDFDKYPRSFDTDIKMLESENCDIVFMPTEQEMYPEKDLRKFDFGDLADVMEGAHRPGHFNGVAQIVSKLFNAVPAHKAFFGQKDFQQYVIIKDLVRQLKLDIEIIACPIIREESGLAMSSRNQRLSKLEKEEASQISSILAWAKDNYTAYSVLDLKSIINERFSQIEALDLEYFEIVDGESLQPIQNWEDKRKIVACVAVFCGNVRLIDNIVFNL
jgi:pantoate--beta-alanine ligase